MSESQAVGGGPALLTKVGRTVMVAVVAGATLALCTTPAEPPTTSVATTSALRVETLVSGLDTPWDLAWGPDGSIWVTERSGLLSRVDPARASSRRWAR